MATETFAQKPIGYVALLTHNRNFRYLWLGQVISLFGDWFNLIASAALISKLTNASGAAVGGLFVVRMLAPFLVSPIAGVVADRVNRKWLLLLSDLSRVVIVFGFLFVQNADQIWLLYTLTALQLGISGFYFPARNAILPDIVFRGELGAANALSAATWSVMLAVGAALGGVVAGEWGIYPAFVIDALTFLLSAFLIFQIHYQVPEMLGESGRTLRDAANLYIDGLRYLGRHLDTLVVASQKAWIALATNGILTVIQVAIAEKLFPIGEGGGTTLGLLYAVAGIGTGIGPLWVRRLTGDRDRSLRIAIAFAYGLVMIGVAIMAQLDALWIILLGSLIRAIGGGINWVFSTQILLQTVPERVRGRVFSSEFALLTLANAISAALGGWLLDHSSLGLVGLIWLMVGLTLVPGLFWTFWILSRRTLP